MLIFISDSVAREVTVTEAVSVAVAPDGLTGDLNAEDYNTLFLLM